MKSARFANGALGGRAMLDIEPIKEAKAACQPSVCERRSVMVNGRHKLSAKVKRLIPFFYKGK